MFVRLQTPQVEFKRLIVDETQQLHTSVGYVFSLASKVKAHHKMVMSGQSHSCCTQPTSSLVPGWTLSVLA